MHTIYNMFMHTMHNAVTHNAQHGEVNNAQHGEAHNAKHDGTPMDETRRGTQRSAGRISLHQEGGGMVLMKLHYHYITFSKQHIWKNV